MQIGITLLVCTYNRSGDLKDLLTTVEAQELAPDTTFEIVVVDNNSKDDTAEVVQQAAIRANYPILYVFESRQGKSFALNTGIARARGEVIAVTDDDQLLPPTYLQDLLEAFRDHPDAAFIGGKVLPVWEAPPPQWLTEEHWGPLGMLDHGDDAFIVGPQRPVCLLTCGFRRSDLQAVGGFREELGVSGGLIGSTEDGDLLERLWAAGHRGLYLPALVLQHKAPARRTTKDYYRRWHRGHGYFESRRRGASDESRRRVLDVPGHMYRQAVADAAAYCRCRLSGDHNGAFDRLTSLEFFWGYFAERQRHRFQWTRWLVSAPEVRGTEGAISGGGR